MALAPVPAPRVSGVPEIDRLADRLRTNEDDVRDPPDVEEELRQTVLGSFRTPKWSWCGRFQTRGGARAKPLPGRERPCLRAPRSAGLHRLHIQAAIALYAQRWAEDCLENMLAVLRWLWGRGG